MKLKASSLRKNSIDKSLARLIIKKIEEDSKDWYLGTREVVPPQAMQIIKMNYVTIMKNFVKNSRTAKIYKFLDSNYQNPLKKKDITLISQ